MNYNKKDRRIAYCGFDCNKCPYEDCVGCKNEGKKLPFCEDGCKIRKKGNSKMCKILKYKYTLLYVLLVLLVGVWSIVDWKFGSVDPLWHLIFYIIVIPILSFVFGVLALKEIKIWLIPIVVFVSIAIVWLVFENGGLTFNIEGLHIVSIPSIVASMVGAGFRKIIGIFSYFKKNRSM